MTVATQWKITLDISQEWQQLEDQEISIAVFLSALVKKMRKLQGQQDDALLAHHIKGTPRPQIVDFGRWIHHFGDQALMDPRYRKNPPSASAMAKFDSLWDAFRDWCTAHKVRVEILG